MKTILITPENGGLKSTSFNNVPKEAWTSLVGGDGSQREVGDLYEKVPWLFRGVNVRVESLLNVPRKLHQGGADGPEVEVYTLRNFDVDIESLLGAWTLHLTMYGAAYAIADVNAIGRVFSVRPILPSSVKPIYDDVKGLIGFKRTVKSKDYIYGIAGKPRREWPANAVGTMAYCWMPNHKSESGPGLAPAQVAARAAGILLNSDVFIEKYFEQGTIMPTVLVAEDVSSDNETERLKSWAKRVLSGIKNAFSITAVSGKLTAITLGARIKDTMATELTTQAREDIATALGVPQTLLFSNAANYATAAQDDLHFYDKTILPLLKKMLGKLNTQVFQPAGYTLVEHHGEMEIYQRAEMGKGYAAAQLWATNAVPREWVWDIMGLTDDYRKGTFYSDLAGKVAAQSGSANMSKPPDLPDVPKVDEPAQPTLKGDLDRWQRLAVTRMKEGKPDKALKFESDLIPPAMVGAIRGLLKNVQSVDGVAGVFDQALVWGVYP